LGKDLPKDREGSRVTGSLQDEDGTKGEGGVCWCLEKKQGCATAGHEARAVRQGEKFQKYRRLSGTIIPLLGKCERLKGKKWLEDGIEYGEKA